MPYCFFSAASHLVSYRLVIYWKLCGSVWLLIVWKGFGEVQHWVVVQFFVLLYSWAFLHTNASMLLLYSFVYSPAEGAQVCLCIYFRRHVLACLMLVYLQQVILTLVFCRTIRFHCSHVDQLQRLCSLFTWCTLQFLEYFRHQSLFRLFQAALNLLISGINVHNRNKP